MSFRHVGVVWRKELLDTIRERRTLVLMIVVPLVVMPIFALGPSLLAGSQESQSEQTTQAIAVVRPEAAPGLVDRIRQSDALRIVDPADDPEQALQNGDVKAILKIPESFASAVEAETTPSPVRIRFDATESSSRAAQEKLSALLSAYREAVVRDRLQSRNLSPDLLEPFSVQSQNVASQQEFGAFLLSFILPLFLVLYASVGGSQTAIDVSAGEKERGTLESLLVAPPSRSSLVMGKFLTIASVTLVATVLALLGFVLAVVVARQTMGDNPVIAQLELALAPSIIALIFGVTALVAAMMSALTFALFTWTRNFKEAQTYSSYISFVVMIPAFIVAFTDTPSSLASFLIPIYNATASIKELVLGNVNWGQLGVTLASSAVYSVASLGLAVRMFRSESVLFRQ
ncbi:MAG: ABC transporter permease [Candidatus Bipolaricaulia bacterium]